MSLAASVPQQWWSLALSPRLIWTQHSHEILFSSLILTFWANPLLHATQFLALHQCASAHPLPRISLSLPNSLKKNLISLLLDYLCDYIHLWNDYSQMCIPDSRRSPEPQACIPNSSCHSSPWMFNGHIKLIMTEHDPGFLLYLLFPRGSLFQKRKWHHSSASHSEHDPDLSLLSSLLYPMPRASVNATEVQSSI